MVGGGSDLGFDPDRVWLENDEAADVIDIHRPGRPHVPENGDPA